MSKIEELNYEKDINIIKTKYNYFINSPWSMHSDLKLDKLIDIYNSSNLENCLLYLKRHNSYCYHKDEYYSYNL